LTLLSILDTDTSTSHIYTLSLHDALPIFKDLKIFLMLKKLLIFKKDRLNSFVILNGIQYNTFCTVNYLKMQLLGEEKLINDTLRSEEHTSELQSRFDLVCRLLLEKKNNI